ncbi:putative Ig domain-containing protein [Shewanella sp. 30m-9]
MPIFNLPRKLRILLASTLILLPSSSIAAGCEDEHQQPLFTPDKQSCAAENGTWFVCMVDNVEEEYIRDRFECEHMVRGDWIEANSAVNIYAPIPKVNSQFIKFKSNTYFVANNGLAGNELWSTDGTIEGTTILKDITYNGSSVISNFRVQDEHFYFTVGEPRTGQSLWGSDGTPNGTQLLMDGSDISQTNTIFTSDRFSIAVEGNLYFEGNTGGQQGLWMSDGTAAGTQLLKADIDALYDYYALEAGIFFNARTPEGGTRELWVTDNTTSGTYELINTYPGGSSHVTGLTALNNKFVFAAYDASNARSLWVSDGSKAGTIKIASVSTYLEQTVNLGGNLIFLANESTYGNELWITDGTIGGTRIIKDIATGSDNLSFSSITQPLDNKVYFNPSSNGLSGIWATDGSEGGTKQVIANNTGNGSAIFSNLGIIKNSLYFKGDFGSGNTFWISDGTQDGTSLLKDINVNGDPAVTFISQFGEKIYFYADDGVHGRELWVSDGTTDGTFMLHDITIGGSTTVDNLSASAENIYFSVNNELWFSDGTVEGTKKIKVSTELASVETATPFNELILTQGDDDIVTITLSLNASDKGSLSVNNIGPIDLGQAQSLLKGVVYTPVNGGGEYTVQAKIVINDGVNEPSLYTHDIHVSNGNNVPTISGSPSTTVDQDTDYNFIPVGSDADGDDLTYSISNKPTWAWFNTSTGALTGTPTQSDVGTTSGIVITVTDTVGATDSLASFNITVTNINDAPTLVNPVADQFASEGTLYSFPSPLGVFTDPDGDDLSYIITNLPSWITLEGNNYTGTPTQGDVGSTTVIVTATDQDGASVNDYVVVTVVNVNFAPIISGGSEPSVVEGDLYSFTPTVTDADIGDTKTFSITNKPTWASFNTSTGALTGTPTQSDIGTTSGIVISVADGAGATDSLVSFDLTVLNTNDAPVLDSPIADQLAREGELYSFPSPDGAFTDPDGDDLSYILTNIPSWMKLEGNNYKGTPTQEDVGSTTVIVTAIDQDGASVNDYVVVTVVNVNFAPLISGVPATSVAEGALYSFIPTVTDADIGDTKTFSIINKPTWASFNTSTGALTGTPTQSDIGTTSGIVISVKDSSDASASLTAFTITVTSTDTDTDTDTDTNQSSGGSFGPLFILVAVISLFIRRKGYKL